MPVDPKFKKTILDKIAKAKALGGNELDLRFIKHANQEATEWVIAEITHKTRGLSQLTILHMSENQIGDAGALSIAEHLPQLTTLNLYSNQIGDAGAQAIADRMPRLIRLSLWGNHIGDAGAAYIGQKLLNLLSLDLTANNIGDNGAKELSRLYVLSELSLGHNAIGKDGAAWLSNLKNLVAIDLERNEIGDAGLEALAGLDQMQTAKFAECNITVNGVLAISLMTDLRTLDLRDNDIGDAAVMAITRLGRLRELNLTNAGISNDGARTIAEAIRDSRMADLISLDLTANSVSIEREILDSHDAKRIAFAILEVESVAFPEIGSPQTRRVDEGASSSIQMDQRADAYVVSGSEFRSGAPASMGDAPATVDLLGRDPWIKALSSMFASPEQATPYTLALFGDWGGGKSSLLGLLTERLKRKAVRPDSIEFDFAMFNAWEYEKTDNIAAGLAQEVVNGLVEGAAPSVDKSASRWRRCVQWFRHRFQRCSLALNFAAREHGWRFWRFPIGAALLIGVMFAAWKYPQFPLFLSSLIPEWLKGAKGGVAAAIPAFFGWSVMIGCFAWGWKNLSELLEHPLSVELHTFLQLPGYKQHLGTVPVLKQQIRTLCEMRLGKQGQRERRLIVYIDDLDRCGPECIVSTLEAVRLVMDLEHVIVLIAVDPRIALKAVGHHYSKLADKHRTSEEIAREYLAKIIQLSVQLPPVSPAQLDHFVREKLFRGVEPKKADATDSRARDTRNDAPATVVSYQTTDRFVETSSQILGLTRTEKSQGPLVPQTPTIPSLAAVTPPIPDNEQERQAVLKDSVADRDAFLAQVQQSTFQNPRQLIRLRNGFRLLKVVAHESQSEIEHSDLLARLFQLERERLDLGKSDAKSPVSPLAENPILDQMVKAVVLPQFLQPRAKLDDSSELAAPSSK